MPPGIGSVTDPLVIGIVFLVPKPNGSPVFGSKFISLEPENISYNFQQIYFGVRRDYLEKQAKLLSIVNRDNNEE